MSWKLKEELRKFRVADHPFGLGLLPKPRMQGWRGSVLKPLPEFKKCGGHCNRTLPADLTYFVETQGGNMSKKCRKCQREQARA